MQGDRKQEKKELFCSFSDSKQQQENENLKRQDDPNKQQPKLSILVISQVHKDRIDNQESVMFTNQAIKKLKKQYPNFQFYSDYQQEFPKTQSYCQNMPKIDYILTIGTNSTLMYTFYRFEKQTTPPILAFSFEGESTLFNFTKCNLKYVLEQFVQKIREGNIEKCLQKFPKLQLVTENGFIKNSTCEIQINRGKNPALVKMELYYQNRNSQEQIYIGKLWGDGLVISTALGSVSRSMVLNGPIIHKKIESLILTPICALSLKFRPIVLPMDANLIIKIEESSRAQGTVYIDGINSKMFIEPGEKIIIRKSDVSTVMVSDLNGSYEKTLFENLQQFLSWGEQFSSKQYKNISWKQIIQN